MKLSSRRFKFLGIAVFALLISIPLIVFGTSQDSWRINSGQQIIADLSSLGRGSLCILNSSGNSYFIPTKTDVEWTSFLAAGSRLNVTFPACCGDGVCSGSDNCTSCQGDCGACATCTNSSFFGQWTGCTGTIHSRQLVVGIPLGCSGGWAGTEVCTTPNSGATGCGSSFRCVDSITYSNINCSGSILNQTTASCITTSLGNGCINYSNYSIFFSDAPSANCSYTPAAPVNTTCTAFSYSPWSGCSGGVQTRSVISQSPANCNGGSPVTSQSCSCSGTVSGCASGTCRNKSTYTSTNTCSGNFISENNICMSASTPNYTCLPAGPSVSILFTSSSGCSYAPASCNTSGCPSGYSCRSGSLFSSGGTCSGAVSNTISSVCVESTYPNSSCVTYNGFSSVIYSSGSGCSYQN